MTQAEQIVNLHRDYHNNMIKIVYGQTRSHPGDKIMTRADARVAYYNKTYLISFKSMLWLSESPSTVVPTNSKTIALTSFHHQILFMDKLSAVISLFLFRNATCFPVDSINARIWFRCNCQNTVLKCENGNSNETFVFLMNLFIR